MATNITNPDEIRQRVEALQQTITRIADDQGRSYEEALADLERWALKERFTKFVARNRADATARGYKPSDVEQWIEEDRKLQREH